MTDSYSYDSHDKLTSTSSKSFAYDNAGNCTSVTVGGNTTSLTWDDSSRCTGITYPSSATNSFVYNGDDLRVSKTDSAGTSTPITDGTEPASVVLKDARAVYTPGISERTTGGSPASKFYHTDALGSTRGITNSSQAVTDAILYDAFGMTVSRSGSTATPFGFVGAGQYQTDADSGLMLLGHRLYDASVGRFISSDPAKAGTNWYAYCENKPLAGTDPMGLDGPFDPLNERETAIIGSSTIFGFGLGAMIGGIGAGGAGTVLEPGGGTLVGAVGGALAGGLQGGLAGWGIGVATVGALRLVDMMSKTSGPAGDPRGKNPRGPAKPDPGPKPPSRPTPSRPIFKPRPPKAPEPEPIPPEWWQSPDDSFDTLLWQLISQLYSGPSSPFPPPWGW